MTLLVSDPAELTGQSFHGSTVAGTVALQVSVEDVFDEVRFHIDREPQPSHVERQAPYTFELDTTSLTDGPHVLEVFGRLDSADRLIGVADFVVGNATRGDEGNDTGGRGATGPGGPGADDGEWDDDRGGWTPPPPADAAPGNPGGGWPGYGPLPEAPSIPGGAIRIQPGDDAVQMVRQAPAGSVFVFAPGVHRIEQSISPRNGDTFLGEPGAVLSGARLLTNARRSNGLWQITGQRQESWTHGKEGCSSSAPRCHHPEELFLDDERLHHVGSLNDVVPGSWYFDYGSDTIYLADDPTGRKLETSVASAAISGDAHDVTIQGLTIEKFANNAQRGAIMADRVASSVTMGRNWQILDNVVRWNHGPGIRASDQALIARNAVLYNGQLGITSVRGSNTVIEANEIAYNNVAGFDWGWEGGGTKFRETVDLVVRNNYSHHNNGPGLWTDINNYRTLYEGNIIEFNTESGIFHEISYDAVIRNNYLRGNGAGKGRNSYGFVFGAAILVYSSSNVEVYGNTAIDNFNGIVGLQHPRGGGGVADRGPWEVRNLYVHDNVIAMKFNPDARGPQGERGVMQMSGLAQDHGQEFVFDSSYNNRFAHNTYYVENTQNRHFTYGGRNLRFDEWKGHDQGAVIAVGLPDDDRLAMR